MLTARPNLAVKMGLATIVLMCSGSIVAYINCVDDQWRTHEVICISSDDEFTMDNGVVSGTGSAEEPYVIEGWFVVIGEETGIRIQGTSAHFVIRDCKLVGVGQEGIGIVLGESSSARATIEQSTFEGLRTGIFAYRSAGARIEGNSFVNCRRGIDGSEADGVLLRANSFYAAREHAVFLWRCHDGTLEANHVSEGANGFYLDSCHRARLAHNCTEGAQRGIFLWDCFHCVIFANDVRNCDLGVAIVHTSAGNVVFHNSLVGNARPATCDEAENRWDNGYPSGGNYWGEDSVVDVRSGPSQDQAGSDGIADDSRAILFGCIDRYPLVAAPASDANGGCDRGGT